MSTNIKKILNAAIVLITIIFAALYISNHHSVISELGKIPKNVFAEILFLYIVLLFVLGYIFISSTRLNKIKIPVLDSIRVNAHSLFINFFVPGQAGPAYRGYYLKNKHDLKYLDYSKSTLIYYFTYFTISLVLVAFGSLPFLYSLMGVILFVVISYFFITRYFHKINIKNLHLHPKNILHIVLATTAQCIILFLIYFVELHSISTKLAVHQVIAYTGIANLSLFVALTPGAIGIREAFLLFSQKITGVDTNQVVLASVLDRSVYIVYLGLIGLLILLFSAKSKINNKKA